MAYNESKHRVNEQNDEHKGDETSQQRSPIYFVRSCKNAASQLIIENRIAPRHSLNQFSTPGLKHLNKHFVCDIKTKKVSDRENLQTIHEHILKKKVNKNNATLYYTLADLFKISTIPDVALQYIERCFRMVVEFDSFLELDVSLVRKILRSSGLYITSELEVFYALDNWIINNIEERRQFAKDLLLNVRLHLLSNPALNCLLNKTSSISDIDECKAIIQNVLRNKDNILEINSASLTHRYCDHKLFDVVICEEPDYKLKTKQLQLVEGETLKYKKNLATLAITKKLYNAVELKGVIYIFMENNNNICVTKFSIDSNVWEHVINWSHRNAFCTCVFINSIFMIGGIENYKIIDSCIEYDTKYPHVEKLSRLNLERFSAASTVFEGKMLVSGGYTQDSNHPTQTVEVYDDIANKWSYMCSMVNGSFNHSLIAINNKLFVIGANFEVFDSSSETFVALIPCKFVSTSVAGSVSISNKIFVFRSESPKVVTYDITEEKWDVEVGEHAMYYKKGCCVKIPQ